MSGYGRFSPDGGATGFVSEPVAASSFLVGRIQSVVGSCTLTAPGAPPREIKPGDAICQGDIIETAAGGKVGILFIDGTAFNLSDNARAVVKEFDHGGAITIRTARREPRDFRLHRR